MLGLAVSGEGRLVAVHSAGGSCLTEVSPTRRYDDLPPTRLDGEALSTGLPGED